MKKSMYALVTVIIIVSFLGCASMGPETGGAQQPGLTAPNPTVVVVSPMVKMGKKTEVSIVGCGFTPGQEIKLVFKDVNGIMTNIGDDLKPELKVNENGAWHTTWSCGRLISRKLVMEGAYVLTVTDSDYTPLAQAPLAFYEEKEEK